MTTNAPRPLPETWVNFIKKLGGRKMNEYEKHIDLLGYRAKDKVTGFAGIVESVCFDLYGCVQVSLKPPMNEKGEIPQGYWFDVTRLDVDYSNRIIDVPNFSKGYVAEGKKGPADKPARI